MIIGPIAGFWCFLFFNALPTTEIYPLSLHDALPISAYILLAIVGTIPLAVASWFVIERPAIGLKRYSRSEEHTSELQSHVNLVCRLLLEKKNLSPVNPTRSTRPIRPSRPVTQLCDCD